MRITPLNNQNGVALLTALMVMALMTIIGVSASNTTNTELKIAGNEKKSGQAFYAAEAGVYVAIAGLKADSDGWDDQLGAEFTELDYHGNTYSAVITDNADVDDTVFITSTGTSSLSTKKIKALVARAEGDPNIMFGAFGNDLVNVMNGAAVRSYDSRDILSPTVTDTDGDGTYDDETLEGDVGSNNEVILKNDCYIGGEVGLGESEDGVEAELDANKKAIIVGADGGVAVDRVEIGVLFTDGGEVDLAMKALAVAIVDDPDRFVEFNPDKITIPGDYYYNSITLGADPTDEGGDDPKWTLANENTDVPPESINIFIDGGFIMKQSAILDIQTIVDVEILKNFAGEEVYKSDIGTTPYLIDGTGQHVTDVQTVDDIMTVEYDYSGTLVEANGQVVDVLVDDTSGEPIRDSDGNAVLVDSVAYLKTVTDGDLAADYVYTKITPVSGAVNMYMTGTIEVKVNSQITNHLFDQDGNAIVDISGEFVPGLTTIFSIYSSSEVGTISFKHATALSGLVYAPYVKVDVSNDAGVYGAIVGNVVEINNKGGVWFDTALKDSHGSSSSDNIEILLWRELQPYLSGSDSGSLIVRRRSM